MTRHKRRELLEKQSGGESGDEGIISQLKLLVSQSLVDVLNC